MKRYFFFIFISFFCCSIGSAQEVYRLDSLQNKLREFSTEDNTQGLINTMHEIGDYYTQDIQYDSAVYWFERSLELAHSLQDTLMIRENYIRIAEATYNIKHDLDSALSLFQVVLEYNESMGDTAEIAYTYFDIGRVTADQGNFPLSLDAFQKALSYFEGEKDSSMIAGIYNSMGIIASKQGHFQQALDFHDISVGFRKALNDLSSVGLEYNNIGLTLKKMGEYEKAMKYYRDGLTIESEIEWPILRGVLYTNIGNIKELQGSYDSAIIYQELALEIFTETNYANGMGWPNKGLASVYLTRGQPNKAISYANKAYKRGVETGELDLMKQSSEVLANAYGQLGNYERAFEYHKLFKQHSDSLFNAEKVRKVTALEYEYAFEKEKQQQRLAQEKKEAAFEATIDQQKMINLFVILALIVFLIFIIVLVYLFNQKRKVNRELKRKNQLISEQSKNLQEANLLRDKLFSMISHDLRGPMSTFLGLPILIRQLLENKEYDELKEFSTSVEETATHIAQLLDNLLNWALHQQNQIPLDPKPVDLKRCVEESISIFRLIAESKKITMQNKVNSPVMVWADRNAVMIVLRNLINNALKFTPENGQISIRNKQEGDYEILEIQDSGIGMTQEKMEKIFESDPTQVEYGTEGEKGVGLGMRLIKDFLAMNKGKLNIESAPGEGTTFYVSFLRKSDLVPEETGLPVEEHG